MNAAPAVECGGGANISTLESLALRARGRSGTGNGKLTGMKRTAEMKTPVNNVTMTRNPLAALSLVALLIVPLTSQAALVSRLGGPGVL